MMYRAWFVLVLCCAVGCSKGLPPAANPQRARDALETALGAWRDGQAFDSLREHSPAIYFNDEEWQAKKRLLKYEFKSEMPNGQGWRCDVLLTLQNGSSRPSQKQISYLIDTDPAIVIVQQP